MGNDAFVHIEKKRYPKKVIETLLQMMDYKKYGKVFYCGNDTEYKYFSGIKVWQCDEDENEVIYWIRTQAFASGYDIKKQNDTIRYLKKYCQANFESDIGKNRYFETGRLVKGAESGYYFAIRVCQVNCVHNLDACTTDLSSINFSPHLGQKTESSAT